VSYLLSGHVNIKTPQFRKRKGGTFDNLAKQTTAFMSLEGDEKSFSFSSTLAQKMSPPQNWISLGSQFNFGFDNLVKNKNSLVLTSSYCKLTNLHKSIKL
jgi:hypothetical protein